MKPAGSDVMFELAQVKRAAKIAADMTKRLLSFSRQEPFAPRVIDVNEVVRGLEPMLVRLIGGVEYRSVLKPTLELVWSDPTEVEQIILNLVINARDAMPDGGRITIETSDVLLDDAYAAEHRVEPGDYVLIAVSDSGHGMDNATRERIFEPFFTTKELGSGTGLGLSTVFGIVERAGGHVWFYSEPGRGAVFKIYLPRTECDVATPPRSLGEANPAPRGSGERILLVEDNEQVRGFTARLLEEAGYAVTAVDSPRDAIERWSTSGGFDVLLTDVILPGMSGPTLAARLTPAPNTIFMSGYTGDAAIHQGFLDADSHFVAKPFTPETILAAVRHVLATT